MSNKPKSMAIPYGDGFTMMLMVCHYDHGMLNAVSTDDADGITTFVLEKKRKIGGKKSTMDPRKVFWKSWI